MTNKGQGLVYVFTGNGKGKTSAAIGVALRARGAGLKTGWIAWYKQEAWGLSEKKLLERVGVKMQLMGKGFYIKEEKYKEKDKDIKTAPVGNKGNVVVDKATESEHGQAAREALLKAREMMLEVEVLVLDEINNAVQEGLLEEREVLRLIEERGQTHLVLTGRSARKNIIAVADLVTEMKKVKHPYDKGRLAVKGLDF